MKPESHPSALKFWRVFSAMAVVLVSLALVFWAVDVVLEHRFLRREDDEMIFVLVNILLFPIVVSTWLMLRFFPPRQSGRRDYYLLKWLAASCAAAFLTGGVTEIGPAVEYADFPIIISGGVLQVILNLVLSLVLMPVLHVIFSKCRG